MKRFESVELSSTEKVLESKALELGARLIEGRDFLQTVLSGHLLVERALVARVSAGVRRPQLIAGPQARWTFAQLARLYCALFDPNPVLEKWLFGLNRLRNAIAHELHADESLAYDYLDPRHDSATPAEMVSACVMDLLFMLGAIDSAVRRLPEGQKPDFIWTTASPESRPRSDREELAALKAKVGQSDISAKGRS